jgi:hypothetical protein
MNSNTIFTPGSRSVTPGSNPNILRYIAFFMIFVSMVLVVLGVYFYMQEDAFLKECKLITCKITNIEEKRFGEPVITFTEVNGNYPPFTMLKEYDPSDEKLEYREGETYEVYYYEKDKSRSEVKGFFENHLTSFILIVMGFAFMIDFPILLMVSNKAKKQRQEKLQYGIKEDVVSE